MSENFVGPASVQYNDLVGTSAADRSDHRLDEKSLHAAVGLDADRWTILSYSLYQNQGHASISIYAADRVKLGIGTFEDWIDRADVAGAIPVTQFRVEWPGSMGQFIDLAFKRFEVVLNSRGFNENALELAIVAEEHLAATL